MLHDPRWHSASTQFGGSSRTQSFDGEDDKCLQIKSLFLQMIQEKHVSLSMYFLFIFGSSNRTTRTKKKQQIFTMVMFVFRNSLFKKSFSKLFCVCLPLEKLVNGKHFPVKEKFSLVSRKVFSWKIWVENTFRKLWKI
jgi:hypothetical protein